MFLIRPYIHPNETLTSYLFRLQRANLYARIGDTTEDLMFSWTNLIRNTFAEQCIKKVGLMTNQIKDSLRTLTFNGLLEQVGEEQFFKLTYREDVQYCPECIRETGCMMQEWSLRPNDICSTHRTKLLKSCSQCDGKITLWSIHKGYCKYCGLDYSQLSSIYRFSEKVTSIKVALNQVLLGQKQILIRDRKYSLPEFLQLGQYSFCLMRGLGSLVEDRREAGAKLSHSSINKFSNLLWMYEDFPLNYEATLDIFVRLRSGYERYAAKAQYERLFKYKCFSQIEEVYKAYWSRTINGRTTRGDDRGEVRSRYISKLRAAQILGIDYRHINKLIRCGIIKEQSSEKLLSEQEVMKLLAICTGKLSRERPRRLKIRDIYKKYPARGLNIVNIIQFIVCGFLQPEKSIEDATLKEVTFSEVELDACLQLLWAWKPKTNTKEVSIVENIKVEMGMATITAKGLILNGKVYTNAAMIKHQWFEHAEKFGEWQCPVGYFTESPEYIVLFDTKGLEVATSVEHQIAPDATVLEAYYEAMNKLKERFYEARNQRDRDW
ncbi:TniQ family protein [Paenibacillus aurantiacus]|uniref:TniQ family protein n=1 Tax=Paenibacillus aurantiacus TaxID=1936118 RepID=A0ABV5KRL6_9BACL